MEYGCDLHPPGTWLSLPGGGDRLVLAAHVVVADIEQPGASFCVDCLEDALRVHGKQEVVKSDQESQFTSNALTGVLKRERIAIIMDGRKRALDNIFVERLWRSVKYEDVCLQSYGTMGELTVGLARYFAFYNGERPYQSLETGHRIKCTQAGEVAARRSQTNLVARRKNPLLRYAAQKILPTQR